MKFRSTPLYDSTNISVCLVAIVKDESHVIEEMLRSVLPYINYYFIADTGSTDSTKKVIIDFMKNHQIEGDIIDIPWVNNFGISRSELMKQCTERSKEKRFTYAFMMDADDCIEGNLPIDRLKSRADSYILTLKSNSSIYPRQQIFKLLEGNFWQYKGAVHEYAFTTKVAPRTEEIRGNYFLLSRRLGARNKDQTLKYKRDIDALLKELQSEPNNSRDMFYLALSYSYIHDWSNAIIWFHKRLTQRHFWEEEWWSTLRLAECYSKRGEKGDKEQAKKYLYQAIELYPKRSEQYYDLARLYEEEENFEEAFRICKRGLQVQKPTEYILWFLENIYDSLLPWLCFRMAWKSKQYQEVLSIAKMLNEKYFSNKKYFINLYVRRALKKLKLNTSFTDYPLYDPHFKFSLSKSSSSLSSSSSSLKKTKSNFPFLSKFMSWSLLPCSMF